jgi:hypothetical protein
MIFLIILLHHEQPVDPASSIRGYDRAWLDAGARAPDDKGSQAATAAVALLHAGDIGSLVALA